MSASDDALNVHVAFFDIDRDGVITRKEIVQAMTELGFSKPVSLVVAPILALALPADVAAAGKLRHADSGALDDAGEFDEATFLEWFEATDRDDSGTLSRLELLRGSLSLADGPTAFIASVGEFQLVHLLLARDGGLHLEDVKGFLNGDLFRKLIRKRDD